MTVDLPLLMISVPARDAKAVKPNIPDLAGILQKDLAKPDRGDKGLAERFNTSADTIGGNAMLTRRTCVLVVSLVWAWVLCLPLGRATAPPPAVADGEAILGIGQPLAVSRGAVAAHGFGRRRQGGRYGHQYRGPHDSPHRRYRENETDPPLGIHNSPPSQDWNLPGFDDLGWASHRGPLQADPFGTAYPKELSPEYGVVYGRFKFMVNDPAAVQELVVRVAFRGGLVAYLNGHEIASGAAARQTRCANAGGRLPRRGVVGEQQDASALVQSSGQG